MAPSTSIDVPCTKAGDGSGDGGGYPGSGGGERVSLSLSLAAEEGKLSDERWAQIATDFVTRMGFAESDGQAVCRWVAVRHVGVGGR